MKGLARHPVPVMILAWLAVDKEHQRKGLGQALLKDALFWRFTMPRMTLDGKQLAQTEWEL